MQWVGLIVESDNRQVGRAVDHIFGGVLNFGLTRQPLQWVQVW